MGPGGWAGWAGRSGCGAWRGFQGIQALLVRACGGGAGARAGGGAGARAGGGAGGGRFAAAARGPGRGGGGGARTGRALLRWVPSRAPPRAAPRATRAMPARRRHCGTRARACAGGGAIRGGGRAGWPGPHGLRSGAGGPPNYCCRRSTASPSDTLRPAQATAGLPCVKGMHAALEAVCKAKRPAGLRAWAGYGLGCFAADSARRLRLRGKLCGGRSCCAACAACEDFSHLLYSISIPEARSSELDSVGGLELPSWTRC